MICTKVKLTEQVSATGKTKCTLIRDLSRREHRKCLTNLVKDIDEEDMLVYLYGCAQQGQWLRWHSAMQTDPSLKKLLHVWTLELLSFHIRSIHDQLPSPAKLRLSGKTNLGLCQLCHHRQCTLLHILNGCRYSLQNERKILYHDQTLRAIVLGMAPFVKYANKKTSTVSK